MSNPSLVTTETPWKVSTNRRKHHSNSRSVIHSQSGSEFATLSSSGQELSLVNTPLSDHREISHIQPSSVWFSLTLTRRKGCTRRLTDLFHVNYYFKIVTSSGHTNMGADSHCIHGFRSLVLWCENVLTSFRCPRYAGNDCYLPHRTSPLWC